MPWYFINELDTMADEEEDIIMNYSDEPAFKTPILTTADFNSLYKQCQELSLHLRTSNNVNRLDLLSLKRLNRQMYLAISDCRKRLGELKNSVDRLNTQLLCTKFEKNHLLQEIKACTMTKHVYDSIELDSSSWSSNGINGIANDLHAQMAAKLQLELSQRKELHARLAAILQHKVNSENQFTAKKKQFEDLKHNLQQLLKSAKPLIEASSFDLNAFIKRNDVLEGGDMHVLPNEVSAISEDQVLAAVYDQLVGFVAEKTCGFRVKHVPSMVDEEDYAIDSEDCSRERNSSIPSGYVNFIVETTKPSIEINFKIHDARTLLMNFNHDAFTGGVENWLSDFCLVPLSSSPEQKDWITVPWFQLKAATPLLDLEAFENFLSGLEDFTAVMRQVIETLNNWNHRLLSANLNLKFDPSNSNTLILSKNLEATENGKEIVLLSARLRGKDVITWQSANDADVTFIEEINSIGAKFRTISDALDAQLSPILDAHLK